MHTDFDFTTLRDRSASGSAKWGRRNDAQKAAGAVPMSVADMEWISAPCIVDAMEKAARFGLYGYCDTDDAYRDAVVGWMQRRHGWTIQPEWILAENGVVPAVSVALRAFTAPGDSILIHSPNYYPFTMAVEGNDRVPLYSALTLGADDLYHMDLDDLRQKAADPKTTMLVLCSPHNPTGRIWTPEELRAVADICKANNVTVLSDEIHFDLELDGKHTVFCQAAPDLLEQCMILTSTSKTFNTAGLQLSNTIIPGQAMREAFQARMQADGYGNPSYFGYHMTLAAYGEGAPWVDAMLDAVRGNMAFFADWFAKHMPMVRVLPTQGTYLSWVDFRALGLDDEALSAFLQNDALIAMDEGTMFGPEGSGFIRFNLAMPQAEIQKTLERLLAAAKKRGYV